MTFVAEKDTFSGESTDNVEQINRLVEEQKLLEAARRLKESSNDDPSFSALLEDAATMERAIADLIVDPSEEWTKQGESHGKYETTIHYKIKEDAKLYCRIETPIETDLLLPLLSVLNEVDLYKEWIPSWSMPRIGVTECKQLERVSRGEQYMYVLCDVPWPFSPRDVLLRVQAADDIDTRQLIAVTMSSKNTYDYNNDQNVVSADFEGALLFRACPDDPSKVLVTFKMYMDPHIASVPTSLINFVTRTVIGQVWKMLLNVAEEVRDGKRPNHKQAIEDEAEFYSWVKKRVDFLLQSSTATTRTTSDHNDDMETYRFISYLQS